MESTHITKAVAYCRVSSQKQVTEGNGLESQRARIEEYAKIRGYDLVEIFKDDITGATAGRPAMKAMLAFLKSKREPHIVIVDGVTRLARSMATHIALREKIKAAGGILKSPSLEFGDDSDSQLIEHLLASVSQHQRQKISETTKNRMRGRMLNGYYTYRSPIGYRYQSVSGEGKVLKRDEPVASLIAEVFEGYASGRFQGPAEIMRYLEVHPAWPETRRNHMTIERVLELLNRPLYAGMIDAPDHGIHMREGKHEALISFGTYSRVQERLNGKPKLLTRIDTSMDFPLRGFVECADCGNSITSCWSQGRNEKFPYYICQTRGCPSKGKSIRRDTMEGEFADLLKQLRPTPELYQLASELFRDLWDARLKSSESSRAHLIAEAARVDSQVTTLVDRIVNADSPTLIAAYEERLRALEIQKAEMRAKVADCGRPLRDFDNAYRTTMEFLENPQKLWFSNRLEDKRAVLKLAFESRIVYHRDTGYRTAVASIPFRIFNDLDENSDFESDDSEMVPRRGVELSSQAMPERLYLPCKISDLCCKVFAVGRSHLPEIPLKCGNECGTVSGVRMWEQTPEIPWQGLEPMALTTLKVKNAKPGRHVDGRGLCLLVKDSGARTWVLRMQRNGRRRDYGLGSALEVSLAEARDAAAALRRQVRDGADPVAERRRARKVMPSFETAARDCYDALKEGWKNRRYANWISSFENHVFPLIGTKPVDQVDSACVVEVLSPIWLEIPETARRLLQRIGSVLDFAHIKGWRDEEASLRSVRKGLPRQTGKSVHLEAMPYADVPALMETLATASPTTGRDALRFTIYNAVRSNETRFAVWTEFDLDKAIWTIPGERMKAKETHTVPLSAPALALLRRRWNERANDTGLVFSPDGEKPMSDMTMTKLLRDGGIKGVTVHGFRSAFTDWAAEKTDFPKEVADKALAHKLTNQVEAAYRRTDFLEKRRDLMTRWARHLDGGPTSLANHTAEAAGEPIPARAAA